MIRIEKQFSSSVNQRVTGSSPVGGAKDNQGFTEM